MFFRNGSRTDKEEDVTFFGVDCPNAILDEFEQGLCWDVIARNIILHIFNFDLPNIAEGII